jgi:hypothetical protein
MYILKFSYYFVISDIYSHCETILIVGVRYGPRERPIPSHSRKGV